MFLGNNCSEDIKECESNPCLNNGVCSEPVANGFQCSCPSGVTGTNCEQVSFVNFNGNNIVQLPGTTSALRSNRRRRDAGIGRNWQEQLMNQSEHKLDRQRRAVDDRYSLEMVIRTTVDTGLLFLAVGVSTLTQLVTEIQSL